MFDEANSSELRENSMIAAVRNRLAIDRRDLLAAGAGAVAAAVGGASAALAQSAAPSGQQAPSSRSVNQQGLKLEKQGAVFLIGINRPEAQTRIDFPTYVGLGQAYYEYEHDDSLRAAVLYGVGADFSRGLDPPSWAKAFSSPLPQGNEFLDPLSVTGAVRSKPVVVAVQGQVTRIAHELFLASDIRVASCDARFNQGEVFGGAFPGGGGTIRFVREAGWANAMRYMLTGEDWGAEEARRFGLVQDITDPGKQVDRAIELAKRIATGAPLGVKATLASAHRALSEGEKAAFAALQPEFFKLLRSEDRQEFLRATQENRAPVFVGR
jgi:enoyl-CoA hydratase/carnithine racemase